MSVVRLSVHKNTLAKRKRKKNRQEMVSAVRQMSGREAGFCFIAWDENEATEVLISNSTGPVGRSILPEFVGGAVRRTIGIEDSE